ncbi:MAG: FAD-dependent oxidoreductase, partial [Nitrospirota bacterium]|nr:FAD-dependent oxidoreductase [Nitrospirota bacterium]
MNTDQSSDILVIGGGPAGIVAALTARRYYPEKSVLLAKSVANGVVPCGIPYMAASLKSPEDNSLTSAPLLKNGVEVFCGEAVSLDRGLKLVCFADGSARGYKKLVLAAGSIPFMPRIPGSELGGIFRIYKDLDLLKKMFAALAGAENVAVLGG